MLSSSSNTPRAYSPLMDPAPTTDVVYTSRLDKGKGRAVDFDPHEEQEHAYPPLNDEEEEERRIQQTLAMYASKDMAVRKAKRESKMLAAAASGGGGAAKRGSWFGFLNIGGSRDRERPEQGLPFHTTSPDHSRASSRAGTQDQSTFPYPTLYDPPVNPFQPLITSREPRRARTDSNATITGNSPFGDEHAATAPPAVPLPEPTEQEYGYRGPDWRGGQPSSGGTSSPQQAAVRRTGPEKWWHALCAWGDDLDEGGRDGQAGRTNPNE